MIARFAGSGGRDTRAGRRRRLRDTDLVDEISPAAASCSGATTHADVAESSSGCLDALCFSGQLPASDTKARDRSQRGVSTVRLTVSDKRQKNGPDIDCSVAAICAKAVCRFEVSSRRRTSRLLRGTSSSPYALRAISTRRSACADERRRARLREDAGVVLF